MSIQNSAMNLFTLKIHYPTKFNIINQESKQKYLPIQPSQLKVFLFQAILKIKFYFTILTQINRYNFVIPDICFLP